MQLQLLAKRLRQADFHYFLTSLSYGSLMRLDRQELLQIANDPTQPDVSQRKPKPAKIKAIAVYILNRFLLGQVFFAPLLLNILPAPTLLLLEEHENWGWLKIPYSISSQTRLIDGQHRLLGIRQAIDWLKASDWNYLRSVGVSPEAITVLQVLGEKAIEQLAEIEIGVQIYAGLTVEQERQAFHDTNRLLDKAEPTLCLTFDSSQPINHLARTIGEQCPWFVDRVSYFSNSLSENPHHLMSFSTLVQATRSMFPVPPDASSNLAPYLEWAIAFWDAAGVNLPGQPWEARSDKERKVQRSESMATQAITFLALGKLANQLRLQQVAAVDLKDWLSPLQTIEWSRENSEWVKQGILSVNPKTGKTVVSNTKVFVERLHVYLKSVVFPVQ